MSQLVPFEVVSTLCKIRLFVANSLQLCIVFKFIPLQFYCKSIAIILADFLPLQNYQKKKFYRCKINFHGALMKW
jgi:hypothetical protein